MLLESLDPGEMPEPYFDVVFYDPEDVHRLTHSENLPLIQILSTERSVTR